METEPAALLTQHAHERSAKRRPARLFSRFLGPRGGRHCPQARIPAHSVLWSPVENIKSTGRKPFLRAGFFNSVQLDRSGVGITFEFEDYSLGHLCPNQGGSRPIIRLGRMNRRQA